MTTQPEALRIADELMALHGPTEIDERAAAKLRRLHEVNQALLEALKDFSDYVRDEQNSTDGAVTYSNTQIHRLVFKARAAIVKATGDKT